MSFMPNATFVLGNDSEPDLSARSGEPVESSYVEDHESDEFARMFRVRFADGFEHYAYPEELRFEMRCAGCAERIRMEVFENDRPTYMSWAYRSSSDVLNLCTHRPAGHVPARAGEVSPVRVAAADARDALARHGAALYASGEWHAGTDHGAARYSSDRAELATIAAGDWLALDRAYGTPAGSHGEADGAALVETARAYWGLG